MTTSMMKTRMIEESYRKLLLSRLDNELNDVLRTGGGASVAYSVGFMTANFAQLIGIELPATVTGDSGE